MPIRCLVVGIGGLATGHYLPYLSQRDDIELAYLSRSPAGAPAAQEAFGGLALTSWADAGAFGADVAFNLTTDTQHADVLDQLVATGIPRVFSEKPLVAARGQERVSADDFTRALQIADAAHEASVEIAMGFNYRYFDTVRRAVALLSGASLGALTTVAANAHYACWSHTIDLIRLTCGPLATVFALSEDAPPDAEAPPSRSVTFVTGAGVVGTLTGSARRAWADDLLEISLVFERGRITIRDLDASIEVLRRRERPPHRHPAG